MTSLPNKLTEEVVEWKNNKPYVTKKLSREAEVINQIIDYLADQALKSEWRKEDA